MKKRIAKVLLSVVTAAVLTGSSSIAVGDTEEASNTIDSNYLNMDTIIGYSGTSTGLQLYTEDDNGYYLEIENKQISATQVYYTLTKDEFNALTPILENRNGKIIVEVTQGTVLDADGNGKDTCGNYIHYDMDKFSVSDRVESVFVYNPETNAIDDILYRVDTLAE